MSKNCIFCEIVSKKSPSNIIFENESILAFTPLEQVSPGHTLLIPKKHFKDIFDIPSDELINLSNSLKEVIKELQKKHNFTGVNILHASREDAQQSVFHFHYHIVPRYKDDNLDLWIREKL